MYVQCIYIYIMYDGLSPERVLWRKFPFEKENLYGVKSEHYNVITNLKAAIAKRYICNACDTLYDLTHVCKSLLLVCGYSTLYERSKYCVACNRLFLSEKCFQNHVTLKVKAKLYCQWRQVCRNRSFTVTGDSKH